ncbi:hypothetical protein EYF80_057245 [Liparis tanakae]|uniref:Uncharacterized protein n=1 Tax=Liparis tanakae TaxID=230148 RepID=A0A4Z2EUY4_9TELE|nr:hypothetical protein EYF80_057245 [Liparis tanakae]
MNTLIVKKRNRPYLHIFSVELLVQWEALDDPLVPGMKSTELDPLVGRVPADRRKQQLLVVMRSVSILVQIRQPVLQLLALLLLLLFLVHMSCSRLDLCFRTRTLVQPLVLDAGLVHTDGEEEEEMEMMERRGRRRRGEMEMMERKRRGRRRRNRVSEHNTFYANQQKKRDFGLRAERWKRRKKKRKRSKASGGRLQGEEAEQLVPGLPVSAPGRDSPGV